MTASNTRLTIVQFAGDFREAAERLSTGGPETYRAQRYTVDYVEGLASRLESVTTITGFTDQPYDVVLPSGARAIGAGFSDSFDSKAIMRLVEKTAPNRLILRLPSIQLLRWAAREQCRTMVLLADSFGRRSVKSLGLRVLLRHYLRDKAFEVLANHGLAAANSLVEMGADPKRVIAWDFPALDTPHNRPPKARAGRPFRTIYVGMLIADKGVDDIIDALALLVEQGNEVELDLIGAGETDRLAKKIVDLQLGSSIRLVGVLPNSEIVARMAMADAVVVPSRHRYSEGMPLTIYEAYCSRTPLVVSDHPMFASSVTHEESGLVFPASEPKELAEQIGKLLDDPRLYARLSEGGAQAWERMQSSVYWAELIDNWLFDTPVSREWLSRNAIGSR